MPYPVEWLLQCSGTLSTILVVRVDRRIGCRSGCKYDTCSCILNTAVRLSVLEILKALWKPGNFAVDYVAGSGLYPVKEIEVLLSRTTLHLRA